MLDNNLSPDLAARYGGEELAVVLPQTDISSAQTVGENIRTGVMERFENDLNITINIGIAAWQSQMDHPASLLRSADRALYAAKKDRQEPGPLGK